MVIMFSTCIFRATAQSGRDYNSIFWSKEQKRPGATLAEIDGGGWTQVRHVPIGKTWHPAKDLLDGKDTYGNSLNMDVAWAVGYPKKWDEFLFRCGPHWLIAAKKDVFPLTKAPKMLGITTSSLLLHDPTQAESDAHPQTRDQQVWMNKWVMYAEGGKEASNGEAQRCLGYAGAGVYVRETPGPPAPPRPPAPVPPMKKWRSWKAGAKKMKDYKTKGKGQLKRNQRKDKSMRKRDMRNHKKSLRKSKKQGGDRLRR